MNRRYQYTRFVNGEVATCASGTLAHIASQLSGRSWATEALAAIEEGSRYERKEGRSLFVVESCVGLFWR